MAIAYWPYGKLYLNKRSLVVEKSVVFCLNNNNVATLATMRCSFGEQHGGRYSHI
jgi:hypothetical protein